MAVRSQPVDHRFSRRVARSSSRGSRARQRDEPPVCSAPLLIRVHAEPAVALLAAQEPAYERAEKRRRDRKGRPLRARRAGPRSESQALARRGGTRPQPSCRWRPLLRPGQLVPVVRADRAESVRTARMPAWSRRVLFRARAVLRRQVGPRIEELLVLRARAGHQDDARLVPRADEDVLGAFGTVEEVRARARAPRRRRAACKCRTGRGTPPAGSTPSGRGSSACRARGRRCSARTAGRGRRRSRTRFRRRTSGTSTTRRRAR